MERRTISSLRRRARDGAGARILFALFWIALAAMLDGAAAQTPRDSAGKPAATPREPDFPPIAFFIAKGEPNACGPGCGEWIAAEGAIDRNAGGRFRAFLDRAKRKLPVYFHSPGGSVSGAIEIGRIMRARAMTAGVARTIPQGCDAGKEREAACDAIKRSGRDLPSELRTVRTLCNSACVYALIGARVREVTAGARIGVHATAVGDFDADGAVKAAKVTLSREDQERLKAANLALAGYIATMGIDRALFEAAAEIKHERLRYISREEIARFEIDSREFHESKWTVDEGPPGPLVVVKFVTERRGDGKKQYRTAKIELACMRSKDIRVTYSRELAPGDRPGSIAVSGKGGDFVLPPRRGKPILGYNDIEMEDRYARVPVSFFGDAAAGEAIEFTEAPDISALDKPPRRMSLSTAGLKHAIAVLAQRCNERAR
jgi:hypothetical protein